MILLQSHDNNAIAELLPFERINIFQIFSDSGRKSVLDLFPFISSGYKLACLSLYAVQPARLRCLISTFVIPFHSLNLWAGLATEQTGLSGTIFSK